jgi:hypothetical protein
MARRQKYLVVYGSLYLDQSESIEYAEMQVADVVANCPEVVENIYLVFDVIGTRRQVKSGFAHAIGREILVYVDRHYPSLGARVVGISDDDKLRAGRDRVLRGTRRVDNIHQYLLLGDDFDASPKDGSD